MDVLRKITTFFLLLSLGFQGAFAVETDVPFSDLESLKQEYDAQDNHADEVVKTLSVEKSIPEDTMMLIAAQKEFQEEKQVSLEMPLILKSPQQAAPSVLSSSSPEQVLSDFFGAQTTPLLSNSFPKEQTKQYRVNTRARFEKNETDEFKKHPLRVDIAPETLIQSSNGDVIDPSAIGVFPAQTAIKTKASAYHEKRQKQKSRTKKSASESAFTFDFGTPGVHLLFSKPVKMEIETPNFSDGVIVDIATLHAGDTNFHTGGLSLDGTSSCMNGETSSPASRAVVKNGKVIFYTCGASSFTMNPSGGTTTSNDLRLVIGDCANLQVYYKGNANIFSAAPAATGCSGNSSWPTLRVGTKTIGQLGTAWNTMTTTGGQNGNTYTAVTTLSATVGGLVYGMTVNWSYTAPNAFFRMDYTLTVPAGNTQNVKFYYGMDSYVNGGDTNDVGYFTGGTNPTVGIFDNAANQLLAMKYLSGRTWSGYEAGPYSNISTRITSGANFNGTIQSTGGDLGFGVNWDFGTAPGTYASSTEWRMLPYVATNVPDLVPSIGQPTPSLVVNQTSQLPIVITNAGNASSTGTTTGSFTVPANFSGPTSAFSDNGWSCSATVGSTVTCSKSGSIAPLATDIFNIPIKPLPAAGGTTANFTVSITNAGDSNTTNNSATTALQVTVATQTQTLWLRADAGTSCTTNGCTLSAWNDQSGLGRNATQATTASQPLFVTNAVNFNPAINFNSTAKVLTGATGGQQTIFAVRNLSAVAGYHTLFASAANTDFSIRSASTFNGTTVMNYTEGPNTQDWSNATGTPTYFYVDGKQTLVGKNQYHIVRTRSSAVQNNTYSISSTFSTRGMSGNDAVAELLAYNTTLSGTTIDAIESYLALKYGITLDQTSGRNYVFADGTTAWDAATAGSYKNDIAGIARDATYSLNQIKSQSINNSTDVIISTGSIANNKRALIWANDAGATGSTVSVSGISGLSRITRAWKVEENNGNLGTVKVSYPNAAISGVLTTPVLILSTDGTFSSGTTTTISGSLVSGNWEYLADLADGVVFSFGQVGDTTPPVIQTGTIASGTLIPYGNFTVAYRYSDTGSNINTASFTGKIYPWDTALGTWSGTNIAPSYATLSPAATTTTGTLQVTGLPFGKYRFDIMVSDTVGNSTTQSFVYFVDKVEWTISADTYNIGDILNTVQTFGTGELIITIKTLGAGFSLTLSPNSTLLTSTDSINYWNGTVGWGYDSWNGTAYLGNISSHVSPVTLATTIKNINTSGQQNTFTYRLKYGTKTQAFQSAGNYIGTVNFGLSLNY